MAEEENELTLIQIKKETAQRIKQSPLAEFGDSYDTIINRAFEQAEKKGR